ncbi:glycosyltransferase family 2 protein [Svornostia abyssi]|uniref:Glycosyltransferase family 2 protein n=1 Tax=Svornostia abyssi TaxID=2898438 RepID=A0ABY5PE90_9ACTN|nr:glycosyltransferase family 2 protein [Parviterribacteraceae bacterium J379]
MENGRAPAHRSVTVVIPTRNRPALLRAAAHAAREQHGVDVEVIAVDDASDDADAIRDTAESAGIELIRFDRRRGVAEARNAGIAAARTPWIALLDDDDRWAPRKLAEQLAAAERTGALWVYSDALLVTPVGDVLETHWAPDPRGVVDQLFAYNPIPAGASNVLLNQQLLRAVGPFDTSLEHFADWDLWLRLAHHAPPARADAVGVAYVRHAASMQSVGVGTAADELERFACAVQARFGRRLDTTLAREWILQGEARACHHLRAATGYARLGARNPSRRFLREGVRQLALASGAASPRTGPAFPQGPTWARPTFRPPVD